MALSVRLQFKVLRFDILDSRIRGNDGGALYFSTHSVTHLAVLLLFEYLLTSVESLIFSFLRRSFQD